LPSFDELYKVYRYEEINADTQVFGVIGDPVAHSLSPLIHNAAFRDVGINAVYLPFRVPRGELDGFLKAFDEVPVKGYSVTIPHKEAAAAAAKAIAGHSRSKQLDSSTAGMLSTRFGEKKPAPSI
jgi:3-dehydroquinate dehydratase/shikimate dehydrogenase